MEFSLFHQQILQKGDNPQVKTMRAQTSQNLKMKKGQSQFNVIRQTRKMTKTMTEQQRFNKALQHVKDALDYKHPRPDAYAPNLTILFKYAYKIQTSKYWTWILFIFAYIYMYAIILDREQDWGLKVTIEAVIMVFYWIDIILYLYHKSYQTIKISSKYEKRFYFKIVLIILLSCDFIIFLSSKTVQGRVILPFRLFRGLLPIFYDSITRKSFEALLSSYKDILVYFMLYVILIISFSLAAKQFIKLPQSTQFDENRENYTEFSKAIFLIYSLLSTFPDNQLTVIYWSEWMGLFFTLFIFLNFFFFLTIPATVIFNSFRQTRSKILLVDQIRQQHSLILAFVSLGQENYHIDANTLVKFLLYMYKDKVRYVNYITQICLKLDQNNNGTIQISQFMQLGKILARNTHMLPPDFDDIKVWVKFRSFIMKHTQLDQIVESWIYKFISNTIIILTFINCIVFLSFQIPQLKILDNIFEALFLLDIGLRFLGFGPFQFFKDKWNDVDLSLVLLIFVLDILPVNMIPSNSDVLLKMMRIFRVITFIKLIKKKKSQKQSFQQRNSIYYKGRQLLSQTAIIIPIVVKFFPFILIAYYFLGVIGMEIFYQAQKTGGSTLYGAYSKLSNFKTFIASQFIFIQILIDSGWSMISYDYAQRTGIFFPVVLYFMISHILIVVILSALFKALVWQAYYTLNDQFSEQRIKQQKMHRKQIAAQKKKQQIAQIRQQIQKMGTINSDSVIKRELLQNKLDSEIFKRLKELYFKKSGGKQKKRRRSEMIGQIVLQKKKYLIETLSDTQSDINFEESMNKLYDKIIKQNFKQGQLEVIQEQDLQDELDQLMEKLILNPKIKFSQTMVYPKVLLQLLNQKMINTALIMNNSGFNIDKDSLQNSDAIQFHIYELNVLLKIQKSQRDQKMIILKYMVDNKLISEEQAKNLFSKKLFQKNYHIDVNWIIRKMFLHQTNQTLIKNFQIQYFSDIYGRSFKQINKVTIQPLLRYEALLTFNLRNILRYSQIPSNNFFQILTSIQDKMSNQLLKKGSLLKFVYQIQNFADNWFTIEFKQSEQVRIHFIKNGVWIYNQRMQENQIYYARDLFDWKINQRQDKITCEKILKLLFQSFEGLAFGLVNQNNFFTSNPSESIYDLYSCFTDVSKTQKLVSRKIGISKIMLVVLSKQDQRPVDQFLNYELTDIIPSRRKKKSVDFKFDQTEKQTFEKLKNLSVMDHQKIIDNQGLPFAYILNLIEDIQGIMKLYQNTFVYQVQKVLNQQFDQT